MARRLQSERRPAGLAAAAQPRAPAQRRSPPSYSLSATPVRRSPSPKEEPQASLRAVPTARTLPTGQGVAGALNPTAGEPILTAVPTFGTVIPGKKPADLTGTGATAAFPTAAPTYGLSIPGKKPADPLDPSCPCPGADRKAAERLANQKHFCGPEGSSFFPDAPGGYNFAPACKAHDICYGPCSAVPRATCDLQFGAMLTAICKKSANPTDCATYAGSYFGAVSQFGWGFYDGCGDKP